MVEKSQRAFRILANREDVADEVLAKILKFDPGIIRQVGADALKRHLEASSRNGDIGSLELVLASREDVITHEFVLELLKDALTRQPRNLRPSILLERARKESPLKKDPRVVGPDVELEVITWLLDNFVFAPGEADAIIDKIEIPDNLREKRRFLPPYAELPSVGTITLLARKRPLYQKARTKLLSLLGYAASEDFINELAAFIEDLSIEDDAFWQKLSTVRRLVDVLRANIHRNWVANIKQREFDIAGGIFNPLTVGDEPLPGKFRISEETAARWERLLTKVIWFIRNFEKAYGRVETDRNFNITIGLPLWLACASCYIHEFGSGTIQLYHGHTSPKPYVGELFLADGDGFEVIKVAVADGTVTSFVAIVYPHDMRDPFRHFIKLYLAEDGIWTVSESIFGSIAHRPNIECDRTI